MIISIPFIVIVGALLINTLSYCSAENVYCVTPTSTSCSSCPHNSTNCTTLSEYAQAAELYFTSNTTMVFLPGDHVLDADITVANVTSLTMSGESSSGNDRATVVCSGQVGLKFTNIMNFKLQSLAFISCSRTYTISLDVLNFFLTSGFSNQSALTSLAGIDTKCALLLQSTQYAELVNCSFHDNIGTALVVINSSITAENNDFTHNYCEPSKCISGGGIVTFSSSLTFIGNTTFIGNNAIFAGAGIVMFNSTLNSTGNFHFINNSNIGLDNPIPIPGVGNPVFGTIFARTSSLHFSGTNNFINNSAHSPTGRGCGGAIYAIVNTSLSFTGTNNFINNSEQSEDFSEGGAIFASINTSLSFTGTNNFINNSVNTELSKYSSQGGAIFASTNTSLSFTGTSNFEQNSVTTGGAISASRNCVLNITRTSNFSSNSAREGGAIYLNNNNRLTFDGNISFTDNGDSTSETVSNGGGMYLYNSTFSIMPNTTIYWENNSASFGGAIYV